MNANEVNSGWNKTWTDPFRIKPINQHWFDTNQCYLDVNQYYFETKHDYFDPNQCYFEISTVTLE